MNTPYRVVLDEAAFRALVAGKIVRLLGARAGIDDLPVEIILSDIGWARMACALLESLAGPQPLPPDPPEAREFLPRKRR